MTFAARSCWNTGSSIPPPENGWVFRYDLASASLYGSATVGFSEFAVPVNAAIYWGDGTVDAITTPGGYTHDYAATSGTVDVIVAGTFDGVSFGSGFTSIVSWNNEPAASISVFASSATLVSVPNYIPTAVYEVKFSYCTAFNDSAILSWDTSNLTSMNGLFLGCASFNQPIGSWNTASVTSMMQTFSYATVFNQSLNSWNTSAVTTMQDMFANATNFNQPLNAWVTSSVTDMQYMFYAATNFNQDISAWDTSSVTDTRSMFAEAFAFNQPLNSWNTSSVTLMDGMFASATAFNQPLILWDVSSVTNMDTMFGFATSFNQPLHQWRTDNVLGMNSMFFNAAAFNQDISMWCVTLIPTLPSGFAEGTPLNSLYYPQWGTCPANYLPIQLYNNSFTGVVAGNLPITIQNSPGQFSGQGAGAGLPITLSR